MRMPFINLTNIAFCTYNKFGIVRTVDCSPLVFIAIYGSASKKAVPKQMDARND